MMDAVRDLFRETVVAPADAARRIIDLGLQTAVLWPALALAVVLNALAYYLTLMVAPPNPNDLMLPLIASPLGFAAAMFVVTGASAIALYLTGRTVGGQARFETILALVTWLQFMRLAVQIATLVLLVLSEALAGIFVMGTSLYGIWILMNFVNVAEGFDALGKAFLTLVMTMLALTLGLSVLLTVLGVTATGMM